MTTQSMPLMKPAGQNNSEASRGRPEVNQRGAVGDATQLLCEITTYYGNTHSGNTVRCMDAFDAHELDARIESA